MMMFWLGVGAGFVMAGITLWFALKVYRIRNGLW